MKKLSKVNAIFSFTPKYIVIYELINHTVQESQWPQGNEKMTSVVKG